MKRVIAALLLCTSVVGAQDGGSQGDAFYAAIRANDLTSLEALLKAGADPNAAEPRGGMTPLMHAAVSGSLQAMTLLLDQGASVNAANSAGVTALMMSVTDIDKVSLLLAKGADVNAATKRGRTALLLAAMSDRSAGIVRLLMAKGADPKAVDVLKVNALNAAVRGNDIETIRIIADAGIAADAADFAGFTPLIGAAFSREHAGGQTAARQRRQRQRRVGRRIVPEGQGRNDCAGQLDRAAGGGDARIARDDRRAARCRRRRQCERRAGHDGADARRCHRSPEPRCRFARSSIGKPTSTYAVSQERRRSTGRAKLATLRSSGRSSAPAPWRARRSLPCVPRPSHRRIA